MKQLRKRMHKMRKHEKGQTLGEYALIAALVGVVVISGLGGIRAAVDVIYNDVADDMDSAP